MSKEWRNVMTIIFMDKDMVRQASVKPHGGLFVRLLQTWQLGTLVPMLTHPELGSNAPGARV